ncbi:MAG: hypothetical protein ALAOOOJD_03816 [bacterium]|nr:hypothetical protein [bacterium]
MPVKKRAASKAKRPAKKTAKRPTKKVKRAARKPQGVQRVPEHMHTITPHLVVKGANGAIEFYKKAFGAMEHYRMPMPDGTIMHAEIQIGNSVFFLNDEMMGAKSPQTLGGSAVTVHLQVEDVDALWNQAVAAGCQVMMPLADMFWGDRYGMLVDPFGHNWSMASHIEDVPPEEMGQRAAAAMAQMGGGPQ